jgi:hypothetical protein
MADPMPKVKAATATMALRQPMAFMASRKGEPAKMAPTLPINTAMPEIIA